MESICSSHLLLRRSSAVRVGVVVLKKALVSARFLREFQLRSRVCNLGRPWGRGRGSRGGEGREGGDGRGGAGGGGEQVWGVEGRGRQ